MNRPEQGKPMNAQEIADFAIHWRGQPGFNVTAVGHCKFQAEVTYQFGNKTVVHDTECTIFRNGIEDGKISLEEDGPLVSAIFHLDFTPDFQTYKFDKSSQALIVTGKSSKMGGNYRVEILPK
jgi:hypothetical protein